MSTFHVRSGKGPKGDAFSVSKTWLSVKLCFIVLLIQAVTFPAAAAQNITGLQLHIREQDVVMDNGILQVTLSKPAGMITGIQYNGVDNLLEILNEDSNRGYWDLVWDAPEIKRKKGEFDRMETTNFTVIVETENQIELSFTRMWDPSLEGKFVPLNIDKRFVMLRNSSGFYTYGIYEHLKDWPAFNLTNTRVVFKLRKDKFHYMAMSDNRQRYMPLPDDRTAERGQPLAYPEAVLLVNPVEPEFKGEVDDKYQYSIENKNNRVHGWISTVTDPPMGFWQITPSEEFKSGGPLKQCLTSHVGPITLAIFHSTHYSGADLILQFGPNEPWKKVFGPVFIHLNSLVNGDDPLKRLWEDAKQQMEVEVQSWPYDFPASKDFLPLDQRGSVSGRLLVHDRYISDEDLPGNGTLVGLAAPGNVGSWQFECKGYQFWTKADEKGCFSITGIRPGTYNLFAYVPGLIGDYRYDAEVTISPGCDKDVGTLVYEPPRSGPTLWEIGIPDRTAAEFFVPDPNPKYINKLYLNHTDRFRQYGLWERYADLYPHNDMVYTVGVSDYRKDFFFAQVTRKTDNNTYQGSTWQIKFKLDIVDKNNTYKLRIALATAHVSDLQVRINDLRPSNPHFSTGLIGNDNTIARHGIHGLYRLYNVDVPGVQLVEGNNTIFLTRTWSTSPFQGIMYDYIRLEGPPSSKGNNLGFSSK
ncbi:PREDICTED: probable rhamnogalacturonate lyase B [Prunus mume]|uniref:rhamnogalacturonan endolyase n=1 Tax=Prunus mume TaxID=102107 RepID=A0ABM0N404_PRUMU|nr:PREDICTED: probable rhamnogalacturonate lyase B [Prunus mume]